MGNTQLKRKFMADFPENKKKGYRVNTTGTTDENPIPLSNKPVLTDDFFYFTDKIHRVKSREWVNENMGKWGSTSTHTLINKKINGTMSNPRNYRSSSLTLMIPLMMT